MTYTSNQRVGPIAHIGPPVDVTITLVGDIVAPMPSASAIAQSAPRLTEVLRASDATIANLETTFARLDEPGLQPAAESGGAWPLADPKYAAELRQLGIRGVSLANNHAADWGPIGIAATCRALDESNIAHAGTGTSRYHAAAPAYLPLGAARVALVSATVTAPSGFRAQDANGSVPGRAGAHVLRRVRSARVSAVDYETLSSLAGSAHGPNRVYDDAVHLFGGRYTSDDLLPPGQMLIDDTVAASDRQRFLASIQLAFETTHIVVAAIHSHDPSNDAIDPPPYLVELARDAVDAGANVVHIHGPHRVRGIELHNGAPILYSLGSFVWNHAAQAEVPRDLFEKHQADAEAITGPELMAARQQAYFGSSDFAVGLAATCTFNRAALRRVTIRPFSLQGFQFGADAGLPADADETTAATALRDVADMSALFGTDVVIDGNAGTITVRKDHT